MNKPQEKEMNSIERKIGNFFWRIFFDFAQFSFRIMRYRIRKTFILSQLSFIFMGKTIFFQSSLENIFLG